jgi:phosphoserine phosphatase
LKLLEEAQKRGDEIALASNSPDFLIQALAKRLYIKHYTATRYLLNLQNYFIKIEDIIDGKSKAEYTFDLCKRLGIAIENTTAYSDSLYDLPLLEITGKAIGVNPDKSLLKICQERGWDIVK